MNMRISKSFFQQIFVKDYIEERAVKIASYIIETGATVRQAAKKFGISKSTVHIDVTKEDVFVKVVYEVR